MIQAYCEVFYSLLVGHTFRTLKMELLFCVRATKVKFFTPWYLFLLFIIQTTVLSTMGSTLDSTGGSAVLSLR